MKNQIILAGILINNPVIQQTKKGKKFTVLKLEVKRGITSNKVDIFECISTNINFVDVCKTGDLVEVNGKLYSEVSEVNNKRQFAIIVTNIKFLN